MEVATTRKYKHRRVFNGFAGALTPRRVKRDRR